MVPVSFCLYTPPFLVCNACQTLDLIDSVPLSADNSGGEESTAAEEEGGTTALEVTSRGSSGSLESEVSVTFVALKWCMIGDSPRCVNTFFFSRPCCEWSGALASGRAASVQRARSLLQAAIEEPVGCGEISSYRTPGVQPALPRDECCTAAPFLLGSLTRAITSAKVRVSLLRGNSLSLKVYNMFVPHVLMCVLHARAYLPLAVVLTFSRTPPCPTAALP